MGRDARERIVDTAVELLLNDGYTRIGVNELCVQAGVQKGSFYHFFPSKQDLLLIALDAKWRVQQDTVLRPAFAADLHPLERIQRVFELLYQYQRDTKAQTGFVSGCAFGNIAQELSTHDERIRQKTAQIFEEFAAYFERALREAIAVGVLPLIDPVLGGQILLSYLEGVLLTAKNQNNPELIRTLAPAPQHLVLIIRSQQSMEGGTP